MQKLHQVSFEVEYGISEDDTGADSVGIIMYQSRRNSKGPDWKSGIRVRIIEIVINKPVYRFIRDDIHFGIVQ